MYDQHFMPHRGMEFIQIFIKEVAEGEQSLDVAAGKAYSKSLRRFHNWIVRGIFNVGAKADMVMVANHTTDLVVVVTMK